MMLLLAVKSEVGGSLGVGGKMVSAGGEGVGGGRRGGTVES